jgi:phosphoglycerate kinase
VRTIDDLDVTGLRILVRSDLNVPIDAGVITDDGRIRAALPTLSDLTAAGASVVVMAHLGRPKGERVPELSLAPVAARLADLLGQDVPLAADVTGDGALAMVERLRPGDVALLENVRFDRRETSKDDGDRAAMAAELAGLGDAFVNDGFGVSHRKQASVYDIARLLPHAAGRLVVREVEVLRRLTEDVTRPYVVVLGGAKVSDKLPVIANLLSRVDRLVVGGGMAYTFLAAQGLEVGTSLLERDRIDSVAGLLDEASRRGVEVVLPADIVVADRFAPDADAHVVSADAMPAGLMGLDIGPRSGQEFAEAIRPGRTVFWNGPMGVFEFERFAAGTRAVAAAMTEVDGLSVVGGGDSAAAVRTLGFADDQFGHISTGGGASLEYLEGKPLPGLSILEDEQ